MQQLTALLVLSAAVVSAQDANPRIPFYGYGSIVAVPTPAVVGEETSIDVTVGNSGLSNAKVDVMLSYNDWGISFSGWQEIDEQTVTIPANGQLTVPYTHVFENRGHHCLEVKLNSVDGGNTVTTDDRGQINLETVFAGDETNVDVPIRNNGDKTVNLRGFELLCPLRPGMGLEELDKCPKDFKARVLVDGLNEKGVLRLEPGEEAVATVQSLKTDDTSLKAALEAVGAEVELKRMVVQAEDIESGEVNHVLLEVVHASALEMLNWPLLCCVSDVRTRVLLESMIASALGKLEEGDGAGAIAELRRYIEKATLLECDMSVEEKGCVEKAISIVVDAAQTIAKDTLRKYREVVEDGEVEDEATQISLVEAKTRSGDEMRLAGQYEAACVFYRQAFFAAVIGLNNTKKDPQSLN